MGLNRRRASLALIGLPLSSGCSIERLPPLVGTPLVGAGALPPVRPAARGQRWRYQLRNVYNSAVLDTVQESIDSVDGGITLLRVSPTHGALPAEIHTRWGQVVQDPYWDVLQNHDQPLPLWIEPLQVGQVLRAQTRYRADGGSFKYWVQANARAVARERVTVPAGTFDVLRIERFIRLSHPDTRRSETTRTDTLWLAPEMGRWVARETNGQYVVPAPRAALLREDHWRWELMDWA